MNVNWDALGAIGNTAGAAAVVVSLIYLAVQIRMSNRISRAEASRAPNSDLNALNASFGTTAAFRSAIHKILTGTARTEFEPSDRILLDFYLISITNIQEQLYREIQAGILESEALDFGGAGLFHLPYYHDSWPLYREYLSTSFVDGFERQYSLDATVEAAW